MQVSPALVSIIAHPRLHFPLKNSLDQNKFNHSRLVVDDVYGCYSQCFRFSKNKLVLSLPSSSIITTSHRLNKSGLKCCRKRFAVVSSGNLERFTERSVRVAIYSQREAKVLGSEMVFTPHLLLGLIAEEEDHRRYRGHGGGDGFLGSGVTLHKAREVVRTFHQHHASTSINAVGSLPFSKSTKHVLQIAVDHSRKMFHHFVSPKHISIALFSIDDGDSGSVTSILNRLGANVNQLRAKAVSKLKEEPGRYGRNLPVASQGMHTTSFSRNSFVVRSSERKEEESALARFCVDLTARARDGLIDPVIGRETEIQRILQILCRRTKNSPILLGESGVGKTAIAEGLAISIAQEDVPDFFLAKCLMSLDVALLIAGTNERGELETRVTMLIREILNRGDVILFIDEVHVLIGLGAVRHGNNASGLDIANLVKSSLGKGQLQCIASITIDEYRMHFEKDKALERRFQPICIDEPSQDDAVKILLGLCKKYEIHHNCKFTLEAINAAVHLSARYIPERHLPDKAIDLIDEAGSRARIQASKKKKEQQTCILSKSPDDYWQEIRTVDTLQEMVLASKMKMGSGDICKVVSNSSSRPTSDDEPVVVGTNDIATVASLWSGIPVKQLTVDERMFLIRLDEELKKRIVGQDEAVSCVSRAIKRYRVGLNDPSRPVAVMLFCGPTGIGKMELTKALAACYFGSEAAMVKLDMSEYIEQHSVSKLIGSPPGYVGFEEEGTLIEAIRRQPFTVVVLDEIEKAHPDIFNILLQMFEEGHLTNSKGRRASFKNALVIMTSNVGSEVIARARQNSIGFMIGDDIPYGSMKAIVREELKACFRPELLNRIDEVVVFNSLEKVQVLKILDLMLQEVHKRLMPLGISLEVSESVKNFICQEGYNYIYGARHLRRAVTLFVEDLLSEAILSGDCIPGDNTVIDLDVSGHPILARYRGCHSSDTTSYCL